MPADYSTLPDREIDAMCAERMGWKWVHCLPTCTEFAQDISLNPKLDNDAMLVPPAHAATWAPECISESKPPNARWNKRIPHYSTDRDSAAELEREIERRGLWREYETALLNIASRINPSTGTFEYFPAITATARQRAGAFLRATEEPNGRK